MKTERKILTAFILNFAFSIFEFFGGIFTGSVAIISDALHDITDAASIAISYFLEKKSKKQPDEIYTYGYARFSILASAITNIFLITGSFIVIYNAILRIISPAIINYHGMIFFAIMGVLINSFAAFFTHGKGSLNQKAVNLHMLEDVLGWLIVLIGAVLIKFTNFTVIDPIMSILVSVFILVSAFKNLKEAVYVFLEKAPKSICIEEIRHHITEISGITDIHHIHIWSLDGQVTYATMHIVASDHSFSKKEIIKNELKKLGITHCVIELESEDEQCNDKECKVEFNTHHLHAHHHHNPHHHH
ncbi:MAG: cation transporter [Clostridia bacterium]|nr:cation transporter [Clostridia bacterium]